MSNDTKKSGEYLMMRERLNSNEQDQQLIAIKYFRDLLIKDNEINIHPSILERIHKLLKETEVLDIKIETTFIIANIFDSKNQECIQILEKDHILRTLVCTIFKFPHCYDLMHGCIWGLNNYAVQNSKKRDEVIHSHVMPSILKLLQDTQIPEELLTNILWLVHSLARGDPKPNRDFIIPLLPIMAILFHHRNQQVVNHALWICFYLSEDSNSKVLNHWFLQDKKVVSAPGIGSDIEIVNVSKELLKYLYRESKTGAPAGLKPAVMMAGNIVHNDQSENSKHFFYEQISSPLMAIIRRAEEFECPELILQTIWTLTQLVSTTAFQIQRLMVIEDTVTQMEKLMYNDDPNVRHEATYCLLSIVYNGTIEQSNMVIRNQEVRTRFTQYFSNLNPLQKDNHQLISMFLYCFKRLQICSDTKYILSYDVIKVIQPYISEQRNTHIPMEFQNDCKSIFEYYRKMNPEIEGIKNPKKRLLPRFIKVKG